MIALRGKQTRPERDAGDSIESEGKTVLRLSNFFV